MRALGVVVHVELAITGLDLLLEVAQERGDLGGALVVLLHRLGDLTRADRGAVAGLLGPLLAHEAANRLQEDLSVDVLGQPVGVDLGNLDGRHLAVVAAVRIAVSDGRGLEVAETFLFNNPTEKLSGPWAFNFF